LITDKLAGTLNPGEAKSVKLTVSNSNITPTADASQLSYNNTAEIVQYSTVDASGKVIGRRDYLSVPGNYDPTVEELKQVVSDRNYEPDTDSAANLSIIPPLGDDSTPIIYYVLGASIIVILVAGVTLIRARKETWWHKIK